jgi:hypothetical protein
MEDLLNGISKININKDTSNKNIYAEIYKIKDVLCKWLKDNKIGSTSEKTNNISKDLFWIIIENNITLEEIKKIQTYINENEYIFVEGSLWSSLSKYFNNDKYLNFCNNIFELTPIGLNTSPNATCGKGELLYRLLRPKSIQPNRGDIIDNNKIIELKGKEIRISSSDITGKYYKKIIHNIFNNKIIGNKVKQGGLKDSITYEIEKKQYQSHYIEEFSKIDTKITINLFENLLAKLNVDGNLLELSKIICENGYKQDEYQRILLIDFFTKYKKKMKFDKLIIFGYGNNIKIIETEKDLCKLKIDKDYFRINQSSCIGWYVK